MIKKEDLIDLGLSEEQAKDIFETIQMEINENYVLKEKLVEVNQKFEEAQSNIKNKDIQLESFKNVDISELNSKIKKLQEENKNTIEKYNTEIKGLKIDNAVKVALTCANVKNIKTVIPLLDYNKFELADTGDIKGLSEQIESLKGSEDTSFLFNGQSPIHGAKPIQSSTNNISKTPDKMNYSELCEFMAQENKIN